MRRIRTFPHRPLSYAAAAVLIGLATSAWAANGSPARFFERLDKDGDGRITLSEVYDAQQARRARIDSNGDGVLTREEFVASIGGSMVQRIARLESSDDPRARRLLDRLDGDGDGRLSEAERSAWVGSMFDRLDKDGNARLSEAEARVRAEQIFARVDANDDGVIDRDEASRIRRYRGTGPAR